MPRHPRARQDSSGLDLSPSTIAVSSGRPDRVPGGPLSAPLTMASALHPGAESSYARHGSPAFEAFEQVVGDLEGGQAVGFSSGQAATTAVLDLVPHGGVVVASKGPYNGTLALLKERAKRGAIELRLVSHTSTDNIVKAAEDAALLWLESPTNPMLQVADVEAIATAVSANGTAVAVDNTFATPLRQRPLDLGADFVVHSASKLLSGHTDLVLGAVVTRDPRGYKALVGRRTQHGAIPGAMEAWLAVRGIRTLAVRLDRAEANAQQLVERLNASDLVDKVRYPGFGTIVSFDVAAGADVAEDACSISELVTHATSLGGVESTWERRRRHPAEPGTTPDNLVRLSVGIEDVDDLWADVEHALKAATRRAARAAARAAKQ
ncbi:trans-sulfuration enzyme family protein [Aeromicrobium massiliense]|uniref:trans-sulfuration enzyme family protein n=1 Tax=Aeromicrobium massiliense TaxID=1464554 RepID=UPI0005775B5E|nr:PLP-dependent aspartate aminotransferase family protein [Aeromicrobium massiliense]